MAEEIRAVFQASLLRVELRRFSNRDTFFARVVLRGVQICYRNAIANPRERRMEDSGRHLECRAQYLQKVWQPLGVYSDGILPNLLSQNSIFCDCNI